MSLSSIAIEKGIGAQEHRTVTIIKRAGDHTVMQGRRIDEHIHAANEREQSPDR